MRRIALIAGAALTALACALLPSGALAHGHHHHRGHHDARRSRHDHRGMHAGMFGAGSTQPSAGTTGDTGSSGTETVGPTTSTQPGDAGKIVSFTEGVLTIQLGEGEKATTISGKVTEETEIHCMPAPTTPSTAPSNPNPSDDDRSDGAQGQQGGPSWGESGWGHDDQGSGDDGEGDRDQEGGGSPSQCSAANLTPGTVVHRAELLLTESGAVFKEIELVR